MTCQFRSYDIILFRFIYSIVSHDIRQTSEKHINAKHVKSIISCFANKKKNQSLIYESACIWYYIEIIAM